MFRPSSRPLHPGWLALLQIADPVDKAVAYRAQVARDEQFNDVIATTVFTTPRARFTNLPDGSYLLRVRAIDAEGLEGQDATRGFALRARPEPPNAADAHAELPAFVLHEVGARAGGHAGARQAAEAARHHAERGLELGQAPAGKRRAKRPKVLVRKAARDPEEEERARIREALRLAGGQKSQAAELLGVSRTTLWRRMRELKLNE